MSYKRAVFCWEDWEVFDSMELAAEHYNISSQLLWHVLNNNKVIHKCFKCNKTFDYVENAAERIEKILSL